MDNFFKKSNSPVSECVSECPAGKALEIQLSACLSCDIKCKVCKDLTNLKCPSCSDGYYHHVG